MNVNLLISVLIIVAGLVAVVYHAHLNAFLNNHFGQGATVSKLVLMALGLVLFVWAAYAIYDYMSTEKSPTIHAEYRVFVEDADKSSDYVGNLIEGNKHDPSQGGTSLGMPSPLLTPPGLSYPPEPLVFPFGPSYADMPGGNYALAMWDKSRGLDLNVGLGADCSRHIHRSGDCQGLERKMKDQQYVNQSNKIYVRAPQQIWAPNQLVNFPM